MLPEGGQPRTPRDLSDLPSPSRDRLARSSPQAATSAPLRCRHCREVIGIYEPLLVLVEGQAHETSRAAKPDAGANGEECYHHGCYANRRDAGRALPDGDRPQLPDGVFGLDRRRARP
jgi:hypothetical protein